MNSTAISRSAAILFVVSFATLLATLNETILNVALTPIMSDLNVTAGTVQWVTTAYMLAAAIMVPVTGFLYRSIPTKRLLLSAIFMLIAGTIVGIVAPNFTTLLIGRIIQAIGTGMIVPIGMNLTLAVAPQGKLGTYMGVVSAMTTLGPAFGPIIAGSILSVADWHMLFIVFGVLSALCFTSAAFIVPNVAELSSPKLDLVSTTFISLALIGILYGISTIFSGSMVTAAIALIIGVAALGAFVIRQRGLSEPLIDLRPFSNKSFVLGLIVVVIALMTVFSMNIILPLFMQGSLGFTAFEAAMTLLPACILSCVISPIAGKVFDRFGLRIILPIGLALMTGFGFALSRCNESTTSLQIVLFYAPVIIGCALSMGPTQTFALSSLKKELYPHGVTIVSTAFQIAGCLGSSLFVGILSSVQMQSVAMGVAVEAANASGFQVACLVAVGLGVFGFCLSLILGQIERKRRKNVNEKSAASANTKNQALRTSS